MSTPEQEVGERRSDEPEDRWLSSQEAAQMLGIGREKLRELRDEGALESHRIGHRTVRYSLIAVRHFMRNRPPPDRMRGQT